MRRNNYVPQKRYSQFKYIQQVQGCVLGNLVRLSLYMVSHYSGADSSEDEFENRIPYQRSKLKKSKSAMKSVNKYINITIFPLKFYAKNRQLQLAVFK